MKTISPLAGPNPFVRSAAAVMVVCALAGEVSAADDTGHAASSTQQEALRHVYGDQPERVRQYWAQLRGGLSVNEVDALIGPFAKDFKERAKLFSAASEDTRTYGGVLYTLKFKAGKLTAWWLNRP